MSEYIKLSQLLLSHTCIFCDCIILKDEIYMGPLFPSQDRADLIYNDFIDLFLPISNGIYYVITFLNDNRNKSKVDYF